MRGPCVPNSGQTELGGPKSSVSGPIPPVCPELGTASACRAYIRGMHQNISAEHGPLARVESGNRAFVSLAGKCDQVYPVGYLEDLRREWPD